MRDRGKREGIHERVSADTFASVFAEAAADGAVLSVAGARITHGEANPCGMNKEMV